MLENKKINNLILVFLAGLLGLVITSIIVSLNRGIDFVDEGFYLLSYKHVLQSHNDPTIYKSGVSSFPVIVTRLTSWMHPGIRAYRWYTFILTIIADIILSFGLYKWLKSNFEKNIFYKKFSFIFLFISIGTFLYYDIGIQTLSYNALNNFSLQVSAGLVLYLCSYAPSDFIKLKKTVLALLVLGISCAFSFFIKFPTGILQFAAYMLLLILYVRQETIRKRISVILMLCLGSGLGLLLYFSFFQSYHEWIFLFRKELLGNANHAPGSILKKYSDNILDLLSFLHTYYSWLLLIPFYVLSKNYFPSYFKFKNEKFLWVLVTVAFIFETYHFRYYRSVFVRTPWINSYFFIIVILIELVFLLWFALSSQLISKEWLNKNLNKILLIFTLFFIPAMGAVGTVNPLFLNILFHCTPWLAVILILVICLSDYIRNSFILSMFVIIPALTTAIQIVDSNTLFPYYSLFHSNKSNLFKQTQQVKEIPLLDGIYVDVKTKTFLIELNDLLKKNNFQRNYPIFGIGIPTIVYLFDGISPGKIYYQNDDGDYKNFDWYTPHNDFPVIMVTDESPINDKLIDCMKTKGIFFPAGYRLAGQVYYPVTNSMLKVYFPNNYQSHA